MWSSDWETIEIDRGGKKVTVTNNRDFSDRHMRGLRTIGMIGGIVPTCIIPRISNPYRA